MSGQLKPVLVVPVFNHGAAFAAILPGLQRAGLPIIVVDDGSDPETRDLLESIAVRHDDLELLRSPVNQGKGSAVCIGLRRAHQLGYTHAVQIDGDGQHDCRDIGRFIASARAAPQAVIAGLPVYDRTVPLGRRIGRYFTHVWIWLETLSFDIRDSMCGFRVYPLATTCALLDRVNVGRRMDFDPEILVRLHWLGVPIVQIPTPVTYPSDGKSHFRLLGDNVLIAAMHARLFFGMIARLTNRKRRASLQAQEL